MSDETKVVAPEKEKQELATKKVEYVAILSEFRKLAIEDDEDFKDASKYLREVKSIAKDIDKRRKKITDPLNTALKEFRSWYKPVLDTLEVCEKVLKEKIGAYSLKKEQAREEAMRQIAAASQVGDFAAAHEASQSLEDMPTADGISVSPKWTWTVEDFEQIPREFLCLDQSAIKLHVKACSPNNPTAIPGLKFIPDTSVIART